MAATPCTGSRCWSADVTGGVNDGGAVARYARRLRLALAVAGTLSFAVAAGAQSPQFTPGEEAPENFPAGAGRDETFHSCTACHNFKLVAAQGMTRRQWEESIALMMTKHGMHALDDKDRTIVLDYLEATFPPRAPSGGWQNPFLKP